MIVPEKCWSCLHHIVKCPPRPTPGAWWAYCKKHKRFYRPGPLKPGDRTCGKWRENVELTVAIAANRREAA